jgi:ATP-dependent Lon protease
MNDDERIEPSAPVSRTEPSLVRHPHRGPRPGATGPAELLDRRVRSAALPEPVRAHLQGCVERLAALPSSSEAAARAAEHLDWSLSLPWPQRVPPSPLPDVAQVERHLDQMHAGHAEAKRRLLDAVSVARAGGPAAFRPLVLVGPPGTGKSSLVRAFAAAIERPSATLSVGPMSEEAELFGLDARLPGGGPGMILETLQRLGRRDVVLVLDELDKLQLGAGGDAGGTLLQLFEGDRGAFLDRYLGVEFDLSPTLIIATASDPEQIGESLFDRLELVELWGYTESEKLDLARSHLLPTARAGHGLGVRQFDLTDAALRKVVRSYTEEAGVRQLTRRLDDLARGAAVAVSRGDGQQRVNASDLRSRLGAPRVDAEFRPRRPRAGIAVGLSYTTTGGALVPIEATAVAGSGRTMLTGQLGEVMRESVQTASSWVRGRLQRLGLPPDHLDNTDLHLHLPSASVPKEGPSAGVALALAIFSALGRRAVRHDVGLTGELSLHGSVLPVGGLREKLLAAGRAGLRRVVLPDGNREELADLEQRLEGRVEVVLARSMDDVLAAALVPARRGSAPAELAGGDREHPRG